MTDGAVDLARVRAARARLDELAREHPDAFASGPRLAGALRGVATTAREAAALARLALDEFARDRPDLATSEAREVWRRTLDAIERFDDDNEEP